MIRKSSDLIFSYIYIYIYLYTFQHKIHHHPVGLESLPPELLNMICKYLDWRAVGNFKKALPQISVSGAESDVFKRSLNEISNKKNIVVGEIVSIGIEIERMKEHYFYSLFNLHYFTQYDMIHYIWDISMLENSAIRKVREKLRLEGEMKEIHRWWKKV